MTFAEYYNRGLDYAKENKLDLALKDFEEALKLRPDNADTQQMISMVKGMQAYLADMIQAILAEAEVRVKMIGGIDVDKEMSGDAYYISGLIFEAKGLILETKGLILESKDDYAQAVNSYNEAIKNIPDFRYYAYAKRARASLKMGNYEQAIQDYEKLIQTFPDDDEYKNLLAQVYSERDYYGNK